MKVLGIDTSTKTTAIGLIDDDEVLAEYNLTGRVSHSESVTDMIEEIFEKFEFNIEEIDLIAVGIGPGSFTGLRIGITIAKVMAFALKKEVIGVSSLIANGMSDAGVVATIVDARRGNVYASIIKNDEEPEVLFEDNIVNFEDLKRELNKYESICITGIDGKKFFHEIKNAKLSKNLNIKGTNIAKLGLINYKKNGGDDIFNLVPNYLKISQAEAQYGKDNKKSN
ncbi:MULTISPECIES: tRNA (adenosine(37)-N6)-threonylcarbamoyltransferase complex dimerization subunit type 1 TsaB [Peptoniphilus]|jgi:universal bacterial protein yeaZ|uniref:tRNA (adenosine(37)-N6)-threonylcarbamoyltransferase complex dimerization subunit type 1 TsaB n=1 Tax=Peptoniphilus TaxID=162289 RepID=UPI000287D60E|nr:MULTISPECIES: tRNA (adenosine(37)-N6)-threonylcarbamoyltransferase complex dimerization subunit type 1 TsaB [Peptoniphilus]MDU1043343.1 tRNA (adenosine(37)-N6)-threonylcarbamoyltransferase complex dimerization subunit type 1 TsaB [Peptoniphilus rhinitidis]MDU1954059.1 tRNA (adenosine(37)-N6)-threonylcarbamoyltransferase complex dimerization subunit type 1 TsaB [Peptoniphilus lacydonensis]MDU2109557.1 tRNA (adenosine(37)-N6)-threonylcarbamoyltransferase complex dimerization subunit type 1 TsaB